MATNDGQRRGGAVTAERLRAKALALYYENPNHCEFCGNVIHVPDGIKIPRIKKKRFCDHSCAANYNNRKRERAPRKPKIKHVYISQIPSLTKAALLDKRRGYQSYRSSIRHHANRVYESSGKPYACAHCGYDKHVDICHIKSVASFEMSATIEEINRAENLIALCPNCHWEFDNDLLQI